MKALKNLFGLRLLLYLRLLIRDSWHAHKVVAIAHTVGDTIRL